MAHTNTSIQHYLGVDPSANSSGIALTSVMPGIEIRRNCRTIVPSTGARGGTRLLEIYTDLRSWLAYLGVEKITRACLESASLNSQNRETVMSEVRGVFLLLIAQLGCEPTMLAPKQLKKFAGGSGDASKENIMDAITAAGLWHPQNTDESDACGLCDVAYALDHHETAPLTRIQLEMTLQILEGPKIKTKLVKPRRTFDV